MREDWGRTDWPNKKKLINSEERGGSVGGQRGCRGGLRCPGTAQGRAWYARQVGGDAVTVGQSGAQLPNF